MLEEIQDYLIEIFNFFKKDSSTEVNCQEVYSIIDLQAAMYQFIEKLHIWLNFAHDIELRLALQHMEHKIQKNAEVLRQSLTELNLPGPELGVVNVKTSANTEIIRDELITLDIFIWLQGSIELCLRAIRTTTTNDNLRDLFVKIIKSNIKVMNSLAGYMKLKGWMNQNAVIYPNIPSDMDEKINIGEAFHLWDHLTFRYDNVSQTEIFKDLAEDLDLKILLKTGIQEVLKQQSTQLEKECLQFGIPLPKKGADIIAIPGSMSSFIADDFIFRTLYIGITGATLIHASAVKQSTTNDRIRKYFIELLFDEIDIVDKLIKYGKVKGYLNIVPQYRPE